MSIWEQLDTVVSRTIYKSYSGIHEGEIYVFGGYDEDGMSNKASKYNIKNNTWTELEDLPYPMHNNTPTQAPFIDGKFYIIGGCANIEDAIKYTGMVISYDVETGEYEVKTPRPFNGDGSLITQVEDRIYSFGGYCGEQNESGNYRQTAQVFEYNPKLDIWSEKAPMRGFYYSYSGSSYYYTTSIVLGAYDGKRYVYVGGGYGSMNTSSSPITSGTSFSNTYSSYYNAYDTKTDSWVTTAYNHEYLINGSSSYGLTGTQLIGVEGTALATGGYCEQKSTENKWQTDVRAFNPMESGGSKSTSKTDLPIRLAHHVCVTDSKYVYVLGGRTTNNSYSRACYRYKLDFVKPGVTLNWINPTPENSDVIPMVSNLTYER